MDHRTSLQGLLEYLASQAGCEYISDLHETWRLPFLGTAVRKAGTLYRSTAEWSDAYAYLTGEHETFADAAVASDRLLEYLNGTVSIQ